MQWRSFNPLRLEGLAVSPGVALGARLLAFAMLIRGDVPFQPYLPYVESLDAMVPAEVLGRVLRAAVRVAYLVVLLTPWIRTGAGIAGVAIAIGLLGCRGCMSIADQFTACFWLIVALGDRRWGLPLLRGQLAVLYLGAVATKFVDPDWWTGRSFDALMLDRYHVAVYAWAAGAWPALSMMMGLATMAIQIVLAVCFAVPRLNGSGAALGSVFHGIMVLLLGGTFGPFFAALLSSYAALVHRPEPGARAA